MALTKKNLAAPAGAYALPEIMASMAYNQPMTEIPLNKLEDAPAAWNFFKPLGTGKFLELCDSIAEVGLINPLLVWERDGRYTVLSGHNRKRAYEALLEATGDERYKAVLCVVRNGLDEETALETLIDANWVQRSLTPSEKARCVARKYSQLGRRGKGEGSRTYDLVAKHFGLKATQVYNYIKIASLPSYFLDRIDNGAISLKAGAAVAGMTEPERERLCLELGCDLTTKKILEWIDSQHNRDIVTLSFTIPKDKAEAVRKAVAEILSIKA